MREIKFRGLNTRGEWVYGSLVTTTHGIPHMPKTHTKTWIVESAFGNGGWFNITRKQYVKPETVGQFIGIQCSGGCDLYGGDIVDFYQDGEFYKTQILEPDESGCVWVEVDGFDYDSSPILIAIRDHGFEIELTGNIHENPELLEVAV